MIKINKGKIHTYLESSDIRFAVEDLKTFYSKEDREQERYDFHLKKSIDDRLKEIFEVLFEEKCGYCEVMIPSYEFALIDRFRPYNGVRDGRTYYKDLYWWLTYEWDNLIYSCPECSQYKSNYFPIKGKRATATSPKHLLIYEKPQLINPCTDSPLDHFRTDIDGHLIGLTDEGDQTIELLKLNRPSLTEGRKRAIDRTKLAISLLNENIFLEQESAFLQKIWNQEGDIEFLNAHLSCLLHELEINPHLKIIIDESKNDYASLAKDRTHYSDYRPKGAKKSIETDFFPIEYIHIQDFKSIIDLKIDFPKNELEKYAWIALLGENGLGKSSILQAICIGLSPIYQTGDSEMLEFIRKGAAEATITIKERDSENLIITKLTRNGTKVSHKGLFKHSLIGYGSVRLLPREKGKIGDKRKTKIKYKNLIDPATPINDIMSWLVSIYESQQGELFDTIAYSLKQLLPSQSNEKLTVLDGDLVFENSKISFNSFSDGYRSTISLALDIISTLIEGNTDMSKLTGIVVIDELGNQLHPRWQMQIVSQLRLVFPKINFIISTHHPLCLRGLKANEIIVLNKDLNNDPFILDNLPDPSNLRIDQILTSPIFGLHSAIDPEIEREFDEYYYLLVKENRSPEEEAELNILKKKIPKIKYLGDTLREELAIYAIDKLLAERVKGKSNLNIDGLREEAMERVRSIWEEFRKEDERNDIR